VTVERLDAARVAKLRAAELTYPEVGRTAGNLPAGYRIVNRTRQLPPGTDFHTATRALLHWEVQQRAGLRVAASSAEITPDTVADVRIGFGPLALRAPCRVVYVVDEPNRAGFAYGTLPGHPESGEEAFLLERDGGTVTFKIIAFSRSASALARLGGPVARRIQDFVTDRYLKTLTTG
jgi:uncharacterized protein (UPF0548 family)